jgi:all-trans-8'-apo-beta-carotenal 15,15'-oxygenase
MTPTLLDIVHRSFSTQAEETDGPLQLVEGEAPEGLCGSLYRVVTGRMERGGVRYDHPFDGDGMIVRFAFSGGRVRYRNRFVRTREFLEEEAAGRMLYRNFGTNLPGGMRTNALRMRFKNAANTSVVSHGGKLLVLWEGGVPHRIDPVTLETLGREYYDGALLAPRSLLGALTGRDLPFSAHPRVDPATGELFNFGTLQGQPPRLMLYRADPRGRLDPPASVALEKLHFIHDFVLTPRHRLFFLSPVAFDTARALLGLRTPVAAISQVRGQPGALLIVPREGGEPRFIPTTPCFVFHHANGYEDAQGRLVIDGTRWAEYPEFGGEAASRGRLYDGAGPRLTRFTVDLERATISEETLCEVGAELPVIHPGLATRPHRHVWASGSGATRDEPGAHALLKVDTVARTSVVRRFPPDLVGEPIFVPRPGASREDDGWLLVMVYLTDAHRNDLLVLDAADLTTIGRFRLPHHLPLGFHGTWVGATDQGGAGVSVTG